MYFDIGCDCCLENKVQKRVLKSELIQKDSKLKLREMLIDKNDKLHIREKEINFVVFEK